MASTWYTKALERMFSGTLDLSTATLKTVMIDTAQYTFNASHEFRASVATGAQVGTPQTLGNKTFINGTFNADDVTFPSVAAGAALGAVLGYIDTGGSATDINVFYYDESPDLPVTPDGGNINVIWDATGIATLVNT
jgi:hypothetical protein